MRRCRPVAGRLSHHCGGPVPTATVPSTGWSNLLRRPMKRDHGGPNSSHALVFRRGGMPARKHGYMVRGRCPQARRQLLLGGAMIALGVILLILGAVFHVPIFWTIGIVVTVVGAVLWIAGSLG